MLRVTPVLALQIWLSLRPMLRTLVLGVMSRVLHLLRCWRNVCTLWPNWVTLLHGVQHNFGTAGTNMGISQAELSLVKQPPAISAVAGSFKHIIDKDSPLRHIKSAQQFAREVCLILVAHARTNVSCAGSREASVSLLF